MKFRILIEVEYDPDTIPDPDLVSLVLERNMNNAVENGLINLGGSEEIEQWSGEAIEVNAPDPDHTHCDECGEIIDNAREGCVDCPGWDYTRLVSWEEMEDEDV
jgi:hypothetical protein